MSATDREHPYLHHLIGTEEWHAALEHGVIAESADGFVHLSTIDQVSGTAARYYGERDDLVLLAVPTDAIAPWLRWEESHPDQWFPHVYASLPVEAVVGLVSFRPPFAVPSPMLSLGVSTRMRRADPDRDAAAVPALGDVADGRRGSRPVAEVEPDRVDRYRALLAEPGGLSLVYEEDGELLSAVVGVPERASFGRGEVIPGSLHVSSVATRPDAWGSGLASLLLHHLHAELRDAGFHHVELWTHVDNDRAQHVYERQGYRLTDAPRAYDATGSTIIQYERHLQSRAGPPADRSR